MDVSVRSGICEWGDLVSGLFSVRSSPYNQLYRRGW